jgi:O-antigen ligase
MLAANPLLGVGPDNVRLEYGAYAGLPSADARIHSNNMYLELLAGTGAIGGLAGLWFARRLWRALRQALGASDSAIALGIVAAVVAIAVHGIVDSFLGFTSTYILMAVSLGLAVAAGNGDRVNAHCV